MVEFQIESIRRNKKLFLNYSQMRRACAYELNPQNAPVAFEIIPVLLSLNETILPGYVSGGDEACGVYGIGSSKKLKTTIDGYFPEARKKRISYQHHLITRPIIESLFIMGSIGTIAQNNKSDFDFWVCIDSEQSSNVDITILHEKTDKISYWCQVEFDMEVHFFIMDIKDIRRDDFGKVDDESAGSSQKKFLKEEFYRTMLLVSGKIPFWWVVPPETSQADYRQYWDDWMKKDVYDRDDFIELGCLDDVPREEFLGTTLWHLSKGIKNPFKALIKMAMMEWYLSDSFKGPLLCDVIKQRVFTGPRSLRDADPYLLMLETILEFYKEMDRVDRIQLLRKAFYIKTSPKITRLKLISPNPNYQTQVFKSLMSDWGWSVHLCENLNQIENWSYIRHLKFASKINTFFFSTYKQLREMLLEGERQIINDHDLTLLGRKIHVLFAQHKDKLQLTPFIKKEGLYLEKCIFQLEQDRSGKTCWHLYDATKYPFEKSGKKSIIFSSQRVARTAAWLVNNGLYDFSRTKVEMTPNPSGLNVNDLIDLLQHLQDYFLPVLSYLKMGANLQEIAKHNQIMIVTDLEKDSKIDDIVSTDVIYNNTWGELYTETYPLRKAISVTKEALKSISAEDVFSKVKLHIPRRLSATNIKREIYQAIISD
ncbi:MAG: class I adenylate cyclase [Desulfatiglandales bacterium]